MESRTHYGTAPYQFLLLFLACTFLIVRIVTSSSADQAAVDAPSRPRKVRIGLHAAWTDTPLGLEAATYLRETQTIKAAWSYINLLAQNAADFPTEKSEYEAVRVTLSAALGHSESALATAEWALAARITSPRVYAERMASANILQYLGKEGQSEVFAVLFQDRKYKLLDNIESLQGDISLEAGAREADEDGFLSQKLLLREEAFVKGCKLIPGNKCLSVYLFADVSTVEGAKWHQAIEDHVFRGNIRYIYRYFYRLREGRYPGLQGWKAVAKVKSTEYVARDDVKFAAKLFPEAPFANGLPALHRSSDKEELMDTDVKHNNPTGPDALAHPLSVCDRKSLEYAAVKYIVGKNSFEALDRLADLSVSLAPLLAPTGLSQGENVSGKSDFKDIERAVNRLSTMPGLAEGLYINGHFFAGSDSFNKLNSTISCTSSILRNSKSGHPTERSTVRFSIPEEMISWLNNIESDRRYKRFLEPDGDAARKKYHEFLATPVHKRQLLPIKSNFLQLIMVLNPGSRSGLDMFELALRVSLGNLPIRVGLVPVGVSRESKLMTAGFLHFSHTSNDVKSTLLFMQMAGRFADYFGVAQNLMISSELAEMAFAQVIGSYGESVESLKDILQGTDVKERIAKIHRWAESSGLLGRSEDRVENLITLNGKVVKRPENLMKISVDEQGRMARDIVNYPGLAEDPIWLDTFYPNLVDSANHRLISMREVTSGTDVLQDISYTHWDWEEKDVADLDSLKRNNPNRSSEQCLNKRRLVRDGNSLGNVQLDSGSSANKVCISESSTERLDSISESKDTIKREQDISKLSKDGIILNLVTVWLTGDERCRFYKRGKDLIEKMISGEVLTKFKVRFAEVPPENPLSDLCETEESSGKESEGCTSFFIVNGRCFSGKEIGSMSELKFALHLEARKAKLAHKESNDSLQNKILSSIASEADVGMYCSYTRDLLETIHHLPVEDIVNHMMDDSSHPSEADGRASDSSYNSGITASLSFELTHDEGAPVDLVAVLNPLGDHAQSVSAVLTLFRRIFGRKVRVRVLLLPIPLTKSKCEEIARRYQRTVLEERPKFNALSGSRESPFALMEGLPQSSLLTFSVDTPRAWFITPHSTNYDLDNIFLRRLPVMMLHAEYELQALLVEGSALDIDRGDPVQGLQLELTRDIISPTPDNRLVGEEHLADTIVMANLGYWQLRALPGQLKLQMAQGRSRSVYNFDEILRSKGDFKLASSKTRAEFRLSSLDGSRQILAWAKRKKGMENVSLLGSSNIVKFERGSEKEVRPNKAGVKDVLASVFRKVALSASRDMSSASGNKLKKEQMLHVFTVVSGHLYERFLKIMMLSVTKHSSLPVKFWLLENHLSPNFKRILPKFSAVHGFAYSFVTYKWPFFLREQKTKQREIWAYKILFLDVLFPLDLHRVIFVDADQVANKDLSPLMSIDLHGAPYAFTPFCDTRDDMKGYRFWEQGFWKDTLKGASYKISALYVVDLKRFREISAGDTLRFLYQKLSADPNSLSNLDQDLPNYASAVSLGGMAPVEIFELPKNTLWCESWCHGRDKGNAIMWDLCNNPMTKEPKLESARRIIPGWDEYDRMATETTVKIHREILETRGGKRDRHTTREEQNSNLNFETNERLGKDEL